MASQMKKTTSEKSWTMMTGEDQAQVAEYAAEDMPMGPERDSNYPANMSDGSEPEDAENDAQSMAPTVGTDVSQDLTGLKTTNVDDTQPRGCNNPLATVIENQVMEKPGRMAKRSGTTGWRAWMRRGRRAEHLCRR